MKQAVPFILACTLAFPAMAQESPKPADADALPPLSTTGQWLELQRSGAQAGAPNPIPGEALDLIYQRYLGSFAAPGVVLPKPQGH